MSPRDPDYDPRRRVVAQLGRYTVWLDPLVHLPWGLFRVYKSNRYVGAQISMPSLSDCEWLERTHGIFAIPQQSAAYKNTYWKRGVTKPHQKLAA